jgi:hypothetical protein
MVLTRRLGVGSWRGGAKVFGKISSSNGPKLGQRFCRRWCRKQAMALAGRAARRAWDDQGRPIQSEVREAFDKDVAARGLWQPEGLRPAAAAMVRRR